MKVREIMTQEVATATPDSTLEEIATMMRDEDTGAIPIVEDDELTGIITDRDIVVRCIAEGKDPVETTAEDIASEDLDTVSPDADAREAARLMARKQIRRLPVVEKGRLVGILSLGDIAVREGDDRTTGATLEEVSEGVGQSSAGRRQAGRSSQVERSERGRPSGFDEEEEFILDEGERQDGGRQQRMQPQSAREGRSDRSGQRGRSEGPERQRGRGDEGRAGGSRGSRTNGGVNAANLRSDRGQKSGERQAEGREGAGQSRQPRQGSQRKERPRSADAGSGSQYARKQGIANRSAREEGQRQQRVAPGREPGVAGRGSKRRTG